MFSLFIRLLKLPTDDLGLSAQRRVVLSSRLMVLIIVVTLVFYAVDKIINSNVTDIIFAFLIGASTIMLLLNAWGFYRAAKIIGLSIFNVILYNVSASEPSATAVNLHLFTSGFIALILFGYEDRKLGIGFAIFSFSLYFLSYFHSFSFLGGRAFTPTQTNIFFFLNVSIFAIVNIYLISMILRLNFTVEERLFVKNIKLNEMDLLKSRFFANISHEFRTPLSLILGPIEDKLNASSLALADKEDLKMVKRNANRLLDLVNQLLDLSKLEAGKLELQLTEGNLDEFIRIQVASFDSLAESKQIRFSKHISNLGGRVCFDADKLDKIISNILLNAFKFTLPGGSVVLGMHTSPTSELLLTVTDTSKGIPYEDQSLVFSPFYQSKHTTDDGQIGTGLGLSLVNELVKLYGGQINLASQPDVGTTISVVIPAKNKINASKDKGIIPPSSTNYPRFDTEIVSEEEPIEDLHPDSILVVEDNPDLRNFIAAGFKNQFTVFIAKDGAEGLSLALEHIPNLIISDVMMPTMDGIELTDKIKSDERTSHIPVVLLTAKADAESRMQGYKTGADDYLAKPFSTEELHVRVANLIEQRKKLAVKFREGLTKHVPMPEQPAIVHEPSLDEKFVKRAKEIVEENINASGFGVEKLADEMHLSRAQLFRKFKALIETSPIEFINDIRLNRAAEMIRNKEDTLAQISYAVGYNEQSYFAKRFRKKFGVSPSEYADL
jgi:signal transduction histidine kinase/DNA-binding response OmpR family regulator